MLRLVAEIRRSPAAFRAAEGAVQSFQLRREINANTLARFGRLWVRNLAANLGTFLASPGVGELQGLFDGMPAVVLAGGPTLDELMPLLPRIAEHALLVSVNTPLAACLAAGVQPDCAVVVDPQFWASRYLDWTSGYRGWIVAEPSTHPRVFRRRSNRVFIASSLFPLGERLEEAVGAKGKLGAGGSVSTAAWDLARLMGARPIYAAGLDLVLPRPAHALPGNVLRRGPPCPRSEDGTAGGVGVRLPARHRAFPRPLGLGRDRAVRPPDAPVPVVVREPAPDAPGSSGLHPLGPGCRDRRHGVP